MSDATNRLTAEEKLALALNEIERLEADLAAAEQERILAVKRYERAELAADYKRLNDLEIKLAAAKVKVERLEKELADKNEALTAAVDGAMADIRKIAKLEKELANLSSECATLDSTKVELAEKAERLEKELAIQKRDRQTYKRTESVEPHRMRGETRER